jgi:predicted tellurium resistance membrane protein TerC
MILTDMIYSIDGVVTALGMAQYSDYDDCCY